MTVENASAVVSQFSAVRRGDFVQFIPNNTMVMAMPEDVIHIEVFGPDHVCPPADEMLVLAVGRWVRTLQGKGFNVSAQDGCGFSLRVA